jgi:TM2 domain-containing membrane protein YozV
MAEILSINGAEVKIGEDSGKVITTPIATLQFANPKVGDKVEVYRDGKTYIIKRTEGASESVEGERTINKHIFVWIGTFMFGGFGVDRFMRGQAGLGVLKLLLCTIGWITIVGGFAGWIWTLVDWINGLIKAYGGAYGNDENFTFDENGNYLK